MPRPKRPKLVHTVPTKIRVAEPTIAFAAVKGREASSPHLSERLTNGSDDSDGLVRRKRGGLNTKVAGAQEFTMSGALGSDTGEIMRSKPPSKQTRAGLSSNAKEVDHTQATVTKSPRRDKAQLAQAAGPSQIPSSHPSEPPAVGTLGPSAAISGRRTSLRTRVQGTPCAQSSMLGGVQFKKRTRQPSLLQLAQAQHDAAENFEDEELYDFRPDDESTPLVKSLSQSVGQRTSSPRPTSGPRKRKQSPPEVQVPASQAQHQRSPTPSDRFQSLRAEDAFELPPDDEDNEQPEPTLPRLSQTRIPSPQIFSDILAPPQSSSSPTKPSPRLVRRARPKPPGTGEVDGRKQGTRASISPSPQLNTTPSRISPTKKKALQPPKPLTTASLQNLLPRRRTRQKPPSTYDIPSSSSSSSNSYAELDTTKLDEDEDELSFHAAGKIRRKKKKEKEKKSVTSTSRRGNKKHPKTNPDQDSKAKSISKTYARTSTVVESLSEEDTNSVSADEENTTSLDPGSGKNSWRGPPLLDAKAQAEMKRLADKFKEVDEYPLEFEDVTGSSSSQMRDAR